MDYLKLTREISERTGIKKELFELNIENHNKKIHEDTEYRVYEKHDIKSHFYNGYQYRENYKQGWKSITFSIPIEIAGNFFEILNNILEESGEEKVNLELLPERIEYNDGELIFFLSLKQDEFYQVEFARKNQ